MVTLGKILTDLRKKEDLTQDAAAKGISIYTEEPLKRSTLANYESGLRKPNYEILRAIAKFYNTDFNTLLSLTDLNEPSVESMLVSADERELLEAYRTCPPHRKPVCLSLCVNTINSVIEEPEYE